MNHTIADEARDRVSRQQASVGKSRTQTFSDVKADRVTLHSRRLVRFEMWPSSMTRQECILTPCACHSQVQTLLDSLDKRLSYFTITHFAELLAEERIIVPCDLKVSRPWTACSTVPDRTDLITHCWVLSSPPSLILSCTWPGRKCGPRIWYITV